MGLLDFRDTADAMHDLLDRERRAILAGRFDLLERLLSEKERLGKQVVRKGLDPGDLERLRSKAERNGRLLEAMQSGLTAATSRLKALQQRPPALLTYDAAGHKTTLGTGPNQKTLRR